MSHQKQRRSFTADSGEPAPRGSRLGRIVLIGFAIALVATAAFISSAASANLPGAEFAPFKEETLAADFAIQVDPIEQAVCRPNNAVYSVQIQSLDGFTDTVTLSLTGNPTGTNVTFDPNPSDAPFTSTLTIGITGSTDPVSYTMEISGVSPIATHTTTVGLEVFSGAPGTVTLTSPSDGAEDVVLQPVLIWQAATLAVSYTVEVDNDIAFGSIDYTATVTTTEHTVAVSLAEDTMYYWRVRGINICDPGSYSDAFSFTTLANPTIDSTPASFEESMIVNEVVTNTLIITNTGSGNLEWNIVEAESGNCAAPGATIDWVSLSDTSGSTEAGPGSEVEVVFDAGGLAVDDYDGALCINSLDGSSPMVTVPLDMYVIDFALQAAPAEQSICAPDDAVYSVQVQPLNGFTRTVTLSLSGNPASTSVDFAPNNAAAPFTSTMTIGNTGAAVAGSYEMEITGISTPATHTKTVDLILNAVPNAVVLTSPSNGASDIALKPLMDWEATADTINYTLQIDDDVAFDSIDYTVTVIGTTEHAVADYLQPDTVYFWRVRADNACGEGSYSTVFSFTTRDVPPVLLVDDSDLDDVSQADYTAALDAILGDDGHDIWDTNNSDNEPDAEYLSFYNAVIWFTGSEFSRIDPVAGPGSEGEAALATWLDSGGCFFISSSDYHWARSGVTPLMSSYLGVERVVDDTGQEDVTGVNTVYTGLGPYSMIYPFNDYSDEVFPTDTAEVAFTGTNDNGSSRPAGVNNLGNTYATTFLGYPWEAIAAAGDRAEVLETFLTWCDSRTVWYTMYLPMLQGG